MANKYNFRQAKFFDTVNDLKTLPQQSLREIAIVGRSNAGKSTLLNVLTNQNRLAYTSKTPGRTQHINYFSLPPSEETFIVDLPGYGYAKVPEKVRTHWIKLLSEYLEKRIPLIGLVLIMDIRHPLKELDYIMIDFFSRTNKPIHLVLSKADKLSRQVQHQALAQVKSTLKKDGLSNYSIQLFSGLKKTGVEELESVLTSWLSASEKIIEVH